MQSKTLVSLDFIESTSGNQNDLVDCIHQIRFWGTYFQIFLNPTWNLRSTQRRNQSFYVNTLRKLIGYNNI